MGNIVLLDDLTINKIAAGEVIERPASVVKELVENSIDAGATNITIEIKNGGISYIRVTDNGKGIMPDDMEIAFERHATSKIRVAEDLQKVTSMGFRGEALASIAAISKVTMKSKTEDNDVGYEVVAQGGRVLSKQEVGASNGTIITIEDLFYNTPVRYKFLRKDFTESGYIEDTVTRIALVHPEISIKLINTGKTVLQTSGNNDLKSVIYGIYGNGIAENILDVDYEYDDIRIKGVIGKPEISRANRAYQLFFVNKRYVKDKTLSASSEQAFKGMLPIGRFAFLVLNIEMNPEKVDVNVHPAKLEVRFEEEQKIFKAVYNAIKDTMSKSVTYEREEKELEQEGARQETELETEKIDNSDNIIAQIYEKRRQENILNSESYEERFNSLMNKIEEMKKGISESGTIPPEIQEEKVEDKLESKTEEQIEEQINDILENKNIVENEEEATITSDVLNEIVNKETQYLNENMVYQPVIEEVVEKVEPVEENEKIKKEIHEEIEEINDEKIQEEVVTQDDTEIEKSIEEPIEEIQEEVQNEQEVQYEERIENKEILPEETVVMPVITIEQEQKDFDQETIVLTDDMRKELSQKVQIEDETQVIPTITDEIIESNELRQNDEEINRVEHETEQPFNEMFTSVFGKAPVQEQVAEDEEKYEIPEPEMETVTSENISIFENIEKHSLPNYKVVGIAFDIYSIIEIDKELYIVNNQIANEKIIYEKLKNNYHKEEGKDSQLMLLPDIINLTSKQMDIANENMEMFRRAGFMLEEFGENTIKLSGVPEICMELDTKELFLEVLDEINKVARTDKEAVEDRFISSVASKISLKEKLPQTEEDVDDLMEELLGVAEPFDYQNGKPIAIRMTKADIERKFSRR